MRKHDHLMLLSLILMTSVALAGCTSDEALYSYDSTRSMAAGGSNLRDVQDTFESPGRAQISFAIGGTGSALVTVKDAGGATVFTDSIGGSGGSARSEVMEGKAGTWTITIDFTNWQGGFALDIREA